MESNIKIIAQVTIDELKVYHRNELQLIFVYENDEVSIYQLCQNCKLVDRLPYINISFSSIGVSAQFVDHHFPVMGQYKFIAEYANPDYLEILQNNLQQAINGKFKSLVEVL